jgi:small subunit ribosomal protein S21
MISKKQKQHQQIVAGNSLAVAVSGNDLGYALKTWKRKVKSAGILNSVKDRKEFIKPSVKKRKQLQQAQFMQKVYDQHSV